MAKSKKRKPSFDGPAEAPGGTGWVYRSQPAQPAEPASDTLPAADTCPEPVVDALLRTPQAAVGADDLHDPASHPRPTRTAAGVVHAREARAREIVDRHVVYAAAAGLLPVPLMDAAAIAAVQVAMLRSLADHYEVPFSRDRGKVLVTALAGGVVPATAGQGAMRFLMQRVPIAGTVFSYATVSVFASAATYAVGRVFITHFESGGGLDDVDVERSRQGVADAMADA